MGSSPIKSSLINLGCGTTLHEAWDNFDLNPSHPAVQPLNILERLPFHSKIYHACYTSHVLEHLPRSFVPQFLSEIYRILQLGGVVRVVVPNFEMQAREYLAQLDLAASGDENAKVRHEWMIIEIADQMTRAFSGGFMARLWCSRPLLAREFILQRVGQEGGRWIEKVDEELKNGRQPLSPEEVYSVSMISEKAEQAFRKTGEIHRWIYDRLSLATLLKNAGFTQIRVCKAQESYIKDFASYHLDTDENGNTRKPDSLFMEGIVA
jgi:predicted SAM-dependent methyltransferase